MAEEGSEGWFHDEYERWIDRGLLHIFGRLAWVASVVLTFGPVVVGGFHYLTHRGDPGSVWWLVAGMAITLFFVGLDGLRYRIKHHRAVAQSVTSAGTADAVETEKRAHKATQLLLEKEKLANEDLRTEVRAVRNESVDKEHRDTVRRIAATVAESIEAGQPCNYRDPNSQVVGPDFRKAIEVHCQEVIPSCDRWDKSVEQVLKSLGQVADMVVREVDDHLSEPPWFPHQVKRVLRERLVSWAEKPYDLSESPISLNRWPGEDYAFIAGFPAYTKPGLTDEEVSSAGETLNELLRSLTESAQVRLLKVAYDGRKTAKDPALVVALDVSNHHSLPRGDGCPLC